MATIRLSALKCGEHAVIRGIHAEDAIRQRMVSMGFRSGREASVIRRGRLGGPLHIRIGSVSLVIRSKDAEQVEVSLMV